MSYFVGHAFSLSNASVSSATAVSSGAVGVDNTNAFTVSPTVAWSVISPAYASGPTAVMAVGTASGTTSGNSVAFDASSNMYLSGTYSTVAPTVYNSNAVSAALTLPANGNTAAYAVMYGSNGAASWAVAVDGVGNESGNSMAVDSTGNVVLAGSYDTASPTVYNAGAATSTTPALPAPAGSTSAYVVKYNSSGSAQWNTVIDSANADSANAVAVDTTGNVVIAGSYVPFSTIGTANVVSTIAGSGSATFADGTGTSASFSGPRGVAVDAAGNLIVADQANHCIRKITSAGVVTTIAGSGVGTFADGVGTAASFNNPWSVVVDPATGNVFVGDYGNNRVRKVTTDGTVTTLAGSGSATFADGTGTAASFNGPTGVSLDATGNVLVADQTNNRIRKVSAAGVVTTFVGSGVATFADATGTSAAFSAPRGVAVDALGNVFVADSGNFRVRKVTPLGVVSTLAGTGTTGTTDGTGTYATFSSNVSSITDDAGGNLYVTDETARTVRKITTSGVVTTLAGSGLATFADGTGTNASFKQPSGVAVDTVGNLYVTDLSNNRVRMLTGAVNVVPTVYDTNSVTTTSAFSVNGYKSITPTGSVVGSADGTLLTATFNAPTHAVVDSLGNMFVCDTGNNKIRKVTPQGVVSTLAGSGNYTFADGTGTFASFRGPSGAAIDASGNLYVLDAYNLRIRKLTPAGVVTTLAGSGSQSLANGTGTQASFNFVGSFGITMNAGDLYVADTSNQVIRKVTLAGVVTTFVGSGVAGNANGTGASIQFNYPSGITTDPTTGNMFVADGSHWVRKVTLGGVVTTFAGSSPGQADGTGTSATFNSPVSTACDPFGNVFVLDYGGQSLRKINPSGVVTTVFPTGTGLYGSGIFADSTAVYVGNNGNNKILRIEIAGCVVSTLAGNGNTTSLDGVGNFAQLDNPSGVAIDSSGTLYVADYANNNIRKVTAAGVVTTLAGSGTASFANGTGTGASFAAPYGVAVDVTGNVYVAEANNHRIRKITPAGVVTTLAGSGNATFADGTGTAASFKSPLGVAVDASGNVFVSDCSNNRIRKITSVGVVTTLAGSGNSTFADGTGTAASFYGPLGITVDSFGNVYVGDQSNHRIRKISSAGVVTTLAGSGGTSFADGTGTNASFNNPATVTLDSYGNVYVADQTNTRIRKVTPSGVVTTVAGSTQGYQDGANASAFFSSPVGIAIDPVGNLYVGDIGNHRIRKIVAPPIITTFAGSGMATFADGTGSAAGFWNPYGVAIDSAGTLYVTDTINNRIRKVTSAGVVTTLAGSGLATFADGTGINASFYQPNGICVDTAGNVYVTDYGNHRIRKITTAGVVSTLAGSGIATLVNGTGTVASFYNPAAIVGDPAGNLYVADTSNHVIRKITSAGVVTTLAGSGIGTFANGSGTSASFRAPRGIAADLSGNLYVADYANACIRKVTASGVVTTLAGSLTQGNYDGTGTGASFVTVMGICVDLDGNVYVGDITNSLVRKITPAGVVTTIVGTVSSDFNGVGYNATVTGPSGLAFDPTSGNIYIATYTTNRIRKLSTLSSSSTTNSIVSSGTALPSTNATISAAFAVKYNTSGVSQWSAVLDGASSDTATCVATDPSANVFIAGKYGVSQPTLLASYTNGIVTTVAGSGMGTFADGTGTSASFNGPRGVDVDASGNLIVVDGGNNSIRKVSPAGVVTTLAGSGLATYTNGTGTNASFNAPRGCAIDALGNIYIADSLNHVIRKVTSAGVVTTLAGSGLATFADGTGTAASFNGVRGLAIDSAGILYAGDFGNNVIRKITQAGVVTTLAGSGTASYADGTGTKACFNGPHGVAVDGLGNVYVCDQTSSYVRKITAAGVVTTLAGSGIATFADGTGTAASFSTPTNITTDALGNVYVSDFTNNRIRKVTQAGVVTTWVGSGNATFADGAGTLASVFTPHGLAFDAVGNMYIGDFGNNRIRKVVSPTPSPITSAGSNAAFGAKFDANGNSQWTVTVDGAGDDQAIGCATDTAGNFYLAGSYGGSNGGVSVVYNANNTVSSVLLPSASNTAAFVVKYNPSGVAQWSGVIDGVNADTAYSVSTDSNKNVYVAGAYSGTKSPSIYGYGNNSNTLASSIVLPSPTGNSGSNLSSFVVQYDSNGTVKGAFGFTGSNNNATNIAVDGSGNIVMGGNFVGGASTVLYNTATVASTQTLPAALTTQSAYLVRYQPGSNPYPFTLTSSLGTVNNGQQKYITNIGAANTTLNVATSNASSNLATYTITPGTSAMFGWYGSNWYKNF